MPTSDEPRLTREQRRFPDFFLVGHPKCGTTAMYEMLRQHPQVHMCSVKEPSYFNVDLTSHNDVTMSESDYLDLFSGAAPGQQLGEASPGYLRSCVAAQRIASANSRARIVAILREPAGLVRSLHLQGLRTGRETTVDLEAAIEQDASRPSVLRYEQYVKYVDQLERYRAVLPAENILVLIYDDYRRSNDETMRRVYRFIGVDDRAEVRPTETNPSGVRSLRLARAWAWLRDGPGPASQAVRQSVSAVTSRKGRARMRRFYHRLNTAPPPPIDEELMAALRLRFAPEVRRISDYLGRDLAKLWGYPAR